MIAASVHVMWRTLSERYSRRRCRLHNRQRYSIEESQRRRLYQRWRSQRYRSTKTAVALNVYFATNSDRIAPKYYADLNKLGEALTRLPSTVEIAGYTDSLGSDQLNQALSARRALSVKHYLEQHFPLPAERLIAKGYGKSRPRASNDTESGRRQNRRIEVALPQP